MKSKFHFPENVKKHIKNIKRYFLFLLYQNDGKCQILLLILGRPNTNFPCLSIDNTTDWHFETLCTDGIREMERNRNSASLITQNVLIISIENSFVLALIRSLEKLQRKTARHANKAGFYMAVA